MPKLEKRVFIVLLLFSLLLFILSFVNFNSIIKEKNKLRIITTNGALYDFIKNIGGNKIELLDLSFLSKDSHIHEAELLPQDVNSLNSANALFKVGYGIDDWINNYLFNNPQIKVFEVNKGVFLIKENKQINPHYWLSIKNAKIIVKNINEILNTLDSANSFYYNKKTNDYLIKLNDLENFAKDNLNFTKKNKVIITHPSFDYFFKDYNIEIAAKIYSDELKDLTPQEILNLGKIVKNQNIKVIFIEKGFITNLVYQISNIYGLKIFFLNPIEVINKEESYYNLMKDNIKVIREALK